MVPTDIRRKLLRQTAGLTGIPCAVSVKIHKGKEVIVSFPYPAGISLAKIECFGPDIGRGETIGCIYGAIHVGCAIGVNH